MAKQLSITASAALLLCASFATSAARAQGAAATLATVKVQSSVQQPDVSGWGDAPAREVPASVNVIDAQTLADIGARRASDAARLDASVADSYNSPAYWDILSMRGFTLDNRYNYRRDGLPINAETMIPLDNIERIEMLKGTSGIQAGTSAPGGMVNYVVKRPPASAEAAKRTVKLETTGRSVLVAADLGGRFGDAAEWGYRINLANEHLNPYTQHSQGERQSYALAMDWRISRDTLLEWEIAQSHRQQYGVNAYSLYGNALPAPVNPRNNLTYQPWSVPGVFDATTGSVRLQQALGQGWSAKLHYGAQRLRTDDRLAFGYGCSAEGNYDRYCSNGDFDLYDFRSDNERRLSDALLAEVAGQMKVGSYTHDVQFSVMRHRQLDRLPAMQAYNPAGTAFVPGGPDPSLTTPNTNRSEYATEWTARDRIRWGTSSALWLGLRHTSYDRSSVQNTDATTYRVNRGQINTPWVGVSTQWQQLQWYASHGHGVEVFVVPNNPASYTNAGQQLGIGRSRQTEAGVRGGANTWQWHATAFRIERPMVQDDSNYPATRTIEGKQTHQGIEMASLWQQGAWKSGVAMQWLHARIGQTPSKPALEGTQPLNVPALTLRAHVEQQIAQVPGMRWSLRASHEGARNVTEDGSVRLPAWTTVDAALHWDTRAMGTATTWTLGIDNLADHRYWRESPKMFGHYYLYPGAPRTLRLGVTASL